MVSTIKVGVLYLQSKQYNEMSRDFIRGVKLNSLPVTYVMESIGIGANDRQIIEKIEKLHYQEDINIIIGFFGHYNINAVYEHAAKNNILLIASDLGATVPHGIEKHKGVYINSYGINESAYLLGEYFAENNVKNVFSSSSYYDAGYGMLASIEMALQKHDLSFSGHYITPFQPREEEFVLMEQAVESVNADVVFAFHSGLYAKEHAGFIFETGLLDKYNYYTHPFTFNEKLVEKINPDKFFIVGSWINNLENSDCAFTKKYYEAHNEAPSVFSVLGYENALILQMAIGSGDDLKPYNKMIENLHETTAEGPRGEIKFNPETNRTFFNHYIYKVIKKDDTVLFKKETVLINNGEFITRAINSKPYSVSGWQNAYLCH